MLKLKKRYIVNEKNEPVEVVLDLASFEKLEEWLEDAWLAQKMRETEHEKPLTLDQLRKRLKRTKKGS
jgi:hypothetical protein